MAITCALLTIFSLSDSRSSVDVVCKGWGAGVGGSASDAAETLSNGIKDKGIVPKGVGVGGGTVSRVRHANTGGLRLVGEQFIPWSVELIRIIVESYKKENIIANRRDYIAVNLEKLRKDRSNITSFLQIVACCNLSINKSQVKKIHLRIAEYAFRAYTKQQNNDEFNKIKALANDKMNLTFRTVV